MCLPPSPIPLTLARWHRLRALNSTLRYPWPTILRIWLYLCFRRYLRTAGNCVGSIRRRQRATRIILIRSDKRRWNTNIGGKTWSIDRSTLGQRFFRSTRWNSLYTYTIDKGSTDVRFLTFWGFGLFLFCFYVISTRFVFIVRHAGRGSVYSFISPLELTSMFLLIRQSTTYYP